MLEPINAKVHASLRLIAVGLAHVWFWNGGRGRLELFVYSNDISHDELNQVRSRIKVTIELEHFDPEAR